MVRNHCIPPVLARLVEPCHCFDRSADEHAVANNFWLASPFFRIARGRNAVKYADPAASVLSAIIIVMASKGLVKSCAWVLMQAAPDHVDIARCETQIACPICC